jgi:protocatechuate 3,4-dioxygenase alpha subunit
VSGVTPFQTVGPYFAVMLRSRTASTQITGPADGPRIVIEGSVVDAEGSPMPDAFVEVWQADAKGRYRHPEDPRSSEADRSFQGYGWAHTRADGGFTFETVKPGRVPGPDGREQAPHVLVSVMARGILTRFTTRLYFEDEPANADDPILALVPDARRPTLLARKTGEHAYRFDIAMQGPNETVFFDL